MHTAASSSLSGISTYSLYSEAPSLKDPEFFHIEDIKSRARLFQLEHRNSQPPAHVPTGLRAQRCCSRSP